MKQLLAAIMIAAVFFACSSKKKAGIFGTYTGAGGKAKMELSSDSVIRASAKMFDNSKPFEQSGRFSIRNGAIVITWETGKEVTGKFEEKDGKYSFLIGSTNYKQEN